jgi:hypothetical protein
MKNCIVCSKEFEQKTNKGLEQKYCSQLCRMKAYNERKENKANEELNELRQQAQINTSIKPSNIGNSQPVNNVNGLHVGDVWGTLLEGNFNKLKVQNLEERLKEKDQTIDELKKEIMILENQIESLEDEMDQAPSEQGGIMGAVNTFMKNDILVNAAAEKIVSILFPKPQSKTA